MMNQLNEFPQSVIEKIGYYVYLLIDPVSNQIFYVGKGTGNRVFSHINLALVSPYESDKLDRIRSIQAKGLQVDHIIIRHGLTEKEAFEVEGSLIDFIGLDGLTNILNGHNSEARGRMTIKEIISLYEAPKINILEPAILIIVNRLYRRDMNENELYEISRGNWVVGIRREKARYAFSIYNGIVRQVYEISSWSPLHAESLENKKQTRWRFEGSISEELQHYVGGYVENAAGTQNPVRYVNC